MPELAETFTLAAQLAGALDLPFETDSRLTVALPVPSMLPHGPYSLRVFDYACVLTDAAIIDDLTEATPLRVQHQGKKVWMTWKAQDKHVFDIEFRLGMTGGFSLVPTPHTRLQFAGHSRSFYYNDIRKFGGLAYTNDATPVPSVSAQLDADIFYETLQLHEHATWTLKAVLTNQYVVGGIGNYLVAEICFAVGVHPHSAATSIDRQKAQEILSQATLIAQRSAALGGCTLRDFRDLLGRPGKFQTELKSYGKTVCPKCGGVVVPIRHNGETTTWACQECQPKI